MVVHTEEQPWYKKVSSKAASTSAARALASVDGQDRGRLFVRTWCWTERMEPPKRSRSEWHAFESCFWARASGRWTHVILPQSWNILRQVSFYNTREFGMEEDEKKRSFAATQCMALLRALSSIDCSFLWWCNPTVNMKKRRGMCYRSLSTRNSFSRREREKENSFLTGQKTKWFTFFSSIVSRFIYFSLLVLYGRLGFVSSRVRVIDHVEHIEATGRKVN